MKRSMVLFCALVCALNVNLAAQKQPAWVADNTAAFPDRDWISVVESGSNQNTAESLVLNALSRAFKVDVRGATAAQENLARTISQSGSKTMEALTQSQSFSREIATSSKVSGLIGVQTEFWKAPDGTVYANARMNRRECAARYSAAIRENSDVIKMLVADAELKPGSFDAFESLNVAATIAEVTDNYQFILEVLDPQAASRKPAYGSAAAIKRLMQEAARKITISVFVDGDIDARLNRAFTAFFKQRGFSTTLRNDGAYTVVCLFNMEDVETTGTVNAVRYTLVMTLTDQYGTEVFAYSGNARQNHNNKSEARQRALRAAEDSITKSGFGAEFDKYLLSLLN